MAFETWLFFLLAAVGLALSPGPNDLLVLTHATVYGARKAIWTIVGGAAVFALLIGLSLYGIGALMKASLSWLTAFKWAGAAYMVWLGIQLWRTVPRARQAPVRELRSRPGLFLAWQGAATALTNIEAIMLFPAFLPQFIDPGRGLFPQSVAMAGTFVLIEGLVELTVTLAVYETHLHRARASRGFNRILGAVFVVIDFALPFRG